MRLTARQAVQVSAVILTVIVSAHVAPIPSAATASAAVTARTAILLEVGSATCVETRDRAPFIVGAAIQNCVIGSLPAPASPIGQRDAGGASYWGTPVWRDEFEGNRVDPNKWNVRSRTDLGLGIDAGIPDPGQVAVSDGMLHIRGDWLDTPQSRPPSRTGVSILTHKTGYLDHRRLRTNDIVPYEQSYGRWEMRAKVPTGPRTLGSLAAFWLRNSQSGEIDIMESWGYGDIPRNQRPGTSTTTVHTKTDGSGVKKFWPLEEELARKLGTSTLPSVHLDFHVWALEYTPARFTMMYDGFEVFTTTPAQSPDFWNPQYFGSPLHVRLNLHVGPSERYWGLPNPSQRELTQPLDFQVDYIRIWAMPG